MDGNVMDMYISRAEHEEAMRRLDAENNRQNARLEGLEKTVDQIHALTVSVEKLAQNVQSMTNAIGEQGKRLNEIENRDGEMWRKVTEKAVLIIVAAVVGYILGKVGFQLGGIQ